jgi:hypothetical protein
MTGFERRGLLKLQLKGNPSRRTDRVGGRPTHGRCKWRPSRTPGSAALLGDLPNSFMQAFAAFGIVLLPVLLVVARETTTRL